MTAATRPSARRQVLGGVLLFVAFATTLLGVALFPAKFEVSTPFYGKAFCEPTYTAIWGGGNRMPRSVPRAIFAEEGIEYADALWAEDDDACVKEMRVRFAFGVGLVASGVVCFIVRRRILRPRVSSSEGADLEESELLVERS